MDTHSKPALWLLVALALAAPWHLSASRLFKCTDASGNTVYQQESCDADQAEEERSFIANEPAPPPMEDGYIEVNGRPYDPDDYPVEAPAPQAAQYVQSGASVSQPQRRTPPGVYRDRFGATVDSRSGAHEELRQAQNRASTREGRRINRELYGTTTPQGGDVLPGSGLPRGPRYVPPPPPPPPRVVYDQHGNRYQGPAGSHFVTDPKTGKQCLAVGNTIRCD